MASKLKKGTETEDIMKKKFRKKRSLFITLLALGISTSVVTACQAPGSSERIRGSDPTDPKTPSQEEQKEKEKFDFVTTEPKNGNAKQTTDNTVEVNVPRKVSDNLIQSNQKIRYISLGDSISAGFDGTLPKDYKGALEVNNSISGLSFASFLARMLNQNNRVESFNNYAISGSTTLDWMRFFNFELDNQKLNTNNSVIFKSLIDKKEAIIAELKNANLITFTLGANDFFGLLFESFSNSDTLNLVQKFFENKPVLGDAIKFVNKLFQKALPEMKKRLVAFSRQLKKLAPNANINIISYPMPLQMLFNVLNQYINQNLLGNLVNIKVFDLLQEIMNDLLKEVADAAKINYVHTYNNEFWTKNAKDLSAIFFDIHPGTKGYKKIALDLYLKITKPYLNKKYYENYDFNQEYLNLDANTASYQIAVNVEDQMILGNSSYEYLNKTSDYEYAIDVLRTPLNFVQRLKELAYIFDYYINDVLDFLTNNSIYNQIDPDGLLKKILYKKSNKGNTLFASLASDILGSDKIAEILANIQLQIDLATKEKNLDFETLKTIVSNNIFSLNNLSYIISSIAKSELVTNNKNELSKALKTIVKNILSIYKTSINNLLTEPVYNLVKDYKIQKNDLSDIFANILNSTEFSNLIEKLIDIFIYRSQDFSNLTNLSQFINSFLANEANNQELSTLINNNFKYIVQNPSVQDLVTNLIYNLLENANLTKNITKDHIKKATIDGFELSQILNTEFKIVDNVLYHILNNLATKGLGNITQVVSQALSDSVKTIFFDKDPEASLVKFIKHLASSKLITNHQELLSQLLHNILDSQNISSLSEMLTNVIRSDDNISRYLNKEDLNNLLSFVLNSNETKELLLAAVDSTIKNYESFKNVQSLNEVVLKIISNFDLDKANQNIITLINSIRNSSQFKKFLTSSLTNYVASSNIALTASDHTFINTFINDLNPIINEINLLEPLINAFFSYLKEIKNEPDILNALKGLPNKLLSVVKERIANPIVLVKKLLNKEYVKNNAEFIGTIAKLVYVDLNSKGLLVNLVNDNLPSLLTNLNVAKYLDQEEITKLFVAILNNNETKNIIYNAIKIVIKDQSLIDKVNDTNSLINALLVKSDVKALIKTSLKNLTSEIFQELSLNKTLAKTLIEISKDTFYAIDTKYESLIHAIIPSVKHVLNQTNKYQEFFNLIFNSLSEVNNLDQITTNLLDKFKVFFDLKDLNLYKIILSSPIFSQNKDLLKEFLKDFLTKIKSPEFPKLLESLLPEKLPYNLIKAELNQTISLIYNNESFHNVLNKAIDLLFDKLDELKQANSVVDALKIILNNQSNLSALGEDINNFVKIVHQDPGIKKIALGLLDSILTNEEYSWILENVQNKAEFLSNTYDTFISELQNLNLIKHFFSALNQFVQGDFSDLNTLLSYFANELFSEFSGNKLETNILRIIKNLNQNYINQNKVALLQVFKNIYNYFVADKNKLQNLFEAFLPANVKVGLDSYLNLSDLTDLLNIVLNDSQFKTNLFELTESILNNNNELSNIASLNDLVFKVIKTLDKTKLKTLLETILNNINTEPWANSIVEVLSQVIKHKYPQIYKQVTTEAFLKNLIKDYFEIDKFATLNTKLIEFIVNSLSDANNQNLADIINKLSISNLASNLFGDLTNKVDQIIRYITTNSNVIKQNKTYFFKVIEFFSLELINNSQLLLEPINNFLVENQILDSTKKITANQFNNLKKFILDIIYYNSNVSLIQKLLDFSDQQLKNITSLESLKTTLIDNLTKALNLSEYDFVKAIISSDFLTKERELVKHIIEKLIAKFLIKDNLSNLLANVNISIFGGLGINDNLKNAFSELLAKDEFKNILKLFVNTTLDNLESLQKATSYNDLVKAIFSIPSLKTTLQDPLTKFIKDLVLNGKFKNWLKKFLTSTLNNPSFEQYFKGITNKERIVTNVIDVYEIIDKHLNFSSLIFNTIFDALKNYGYQLDFSSLGNIILGALQSQFGDSQTKETKVITLIKELANSKLFAENKDDLTKLLANIIDILNAQGTFNNLIDSLPASTKITLEQFIPINSFKLLVNYIASNTHFKSILQNTVYNFITKINEFKDVTSYFDVLKKLLSLVNVSQLETDVNGLIQDLLVNSSAVKTVIKDFLIRTLSTYGVQVNDTRINNLITNISNNLNTILNTTEIIKPIIDKFFEKLKVASNQTSLDKMLAQLSSISNDVTLIIQQKLTNNPKEFVDKLLNLDIFRNDKETLAKILSQLLIGLKNKNVIQEIAFKTIDALDQNNSILTIVDKTSLKLIAEIVLNNNTLNNAVTAIVPELINDTSWLSHTNNYYDLIKNLLAKPNIKNALTTLLTNFINSLQNNPKSTELVLRLIDNLARNFKISLNGINKANLVTSLLNNLGNYLKDINILPNLFTKVFEFITTSNNIEAVTQKTTDWLFSELNLNSYNIYKKFFIHFESLTQNLNDLKLIFNNVYSQVSQNNELIKDLSNSLTQGSLLSKYNLQTNDLESILKLILQDSQISIKVKSLFSLLLNNWNSFKTASDFWDLFNKLLNQASVSSNTIDLIKLVINKLLSSDNFQNVVAKVITTEINATKYRDIFKQVSNPETFVKNSFPIATIINNTLKISDNLITDLINELKVSKTSLSFENILNSLLKTVSNFVQRNDFDSQAAKIFRDILNNSAFELSKLDLIKVIENATLLLIKEVKIGELTWSMLPESSTTFITRNLIEKNQFSAIIDDILDPEDIKDLVSEIFIYIVNNKSQFTNVTSLVQIFKVYFASEQNKQSFQTRIIEILKNGFKKPNAQKAIIEIFDKAIKFLNIRATNNTNTLKLNLSKGFGDFLARQELFQNALRSIFNTISRSNNLKQIPRIVASELSSNLKLTDFNTVKKLLNDQLIQTNSRLIIEFFTDAINNFINDKNKIRAVIDELGLANLIVSNYPELDINLVKDMLMLAVNNPDLRQALNTSISDFITRINEYQKNNSWLTALNTLLRTNEATSTKLKDNFYNWIKTTLKNPDARLTQGIAQVLISKFRDSQIMLNFTGSDVTMVNTMVNNFFKFLADRNELKAMIDKIYERIKTIDFSQVKRDDPSLIIRAITDGAFHFILTNDYKSIQLSKIFNNVNFFKAMIDSLGDSDYVMFINRLFSASSRSAMTGIYSMVYNTFLKKPASGGSSGGGGATPAPSPSPSPSPEPPVSADEGYGLYQDISILSVRHRIADILKIIYRPIFRQMVLKVSNNIYNVNNPKANDEYHAAYRLTTLLLWFLKDKANLGGSFWNIGLDGVQAVVWSLEYAFNDAVSHYRERYNKLTMKQKNAIGGNWNGYNTDFIIGNRSAFTKYSNYWSDQLLAYIYYRENNIDRYSARTMTDVLLDSLRDGYLVKR